mgnify:CR=1 FL=1
MNKKVSTLLASVFIIAICGILYELLISTITSYFQGSSILHFSIVIGLFLSFMGIGSYASKFIKDDDSELFVVELNDEIVASGYAKIKQDRAEKYYVQYINIIK